MTVVTAYHLKEMENLPKLSVLIVLIQWAPQHIHANLRVHVKINAHNAKIMVFQPKLIHLELLVIVAPRIRFKQLKSLIHHHWI